MSAITRWEIEVAMKAKSLAHVQKFEMDLDISTYKLIPVAISNATKVSDTWLGDGI
jgi:hypothetical protein